VFGCNSERVLLILKIKDCHYAMIGSGMKISGVLNPPPVGCSVGGLVRLQMKLGNVVGVVIGGKVQTMIGGAGCSVGVGVKTQMKNGLPVGSNVGSLGAVCLNCNSSNNPSDTFSLEYASEYT
jgi:hypothetical protein